MTSSQHVYEVRPRKDHRGIDLISDALPFGRRLWYGEPAAVASAIDYAGAIVEISTTGEVAEPVEETFWIVLLSARTCAVRGNFCNALIKSPTVLNMIITFFFSPLVDPW